MAKVKLKQFACPACKDGTLVFVEVDETKITLAKRYPVIVTAKCPKKNHSLVVFVDANFQVRDVEAAAEASEEKKDAIDKTKGWFDSL
ncbi:MAG: hypothetical protein ACFFDM_03515 [Candidatus Thorarchaeota archaeon]